jgi:thiaminase/transcriptional activator TenA
MATATASLFASLCAEQRDRHACALAHPVVRGIGAGTLPESTFRYYLEQDYQFLLRYARVLGHAVAQSGDLPTTTRLAELLHSTLAVEIDALASLYAAFGGTRADLHATRPAPTCRAYTDHLLATAARGDLLLTLAAILPCQWGYREIGRALAAGSPPADPRYAGWVAEYASEEYGALVDWLVARFETLSDEAGAASREAAHAIFALSSHYELAFWEMAAVGERW